MSDVPKYVAYLAVLPFYRQDCISTLKDLLGDELVLFAGRRHVDATVRTGIDEALYTPVTNLVFFGRALLQLGHWREVLRAETVILDLNPRSISVWIHTVARRLLRRRTLLWGHLFPRMGEHSKTAFLRKALRKLSDGTVLYGYESVSAAKAELPDRPVWVAPNSLYPASQIYPAGRNEPRSSFLYVGRLEPSKKVDLLVRGFASLGSRELTLNVVGEGAQRNELEDLAATTGARVRFWGQVAEVERLREIYATAICSVSPGYVGLSLTQSLGFGVPMIVSANEPHAPEIELRHFNGSVKFFETDSAEALGAALATAQRSVTWETRVALCDQLRGAYSAEAMAHGLVDAFNNRAQQLGENGWPI